MKEWWWEVGMEEARESSRGRRAEEDEAKAGEGARRAE
jgi:hypothetical protein